MKEKYLYIEPETARNLLTQVSELKSTKNGIDSHAYLIDEYAILTSTRIKLRNVTYRDDNLAYFDELILTIINLKEQGVCVVPILGYFYDEKSENGAGYIFMQRAKGEELYDDAIMKTYYSYTQDNSNTEHLSSDVDSREYILSRTSYISKIPQEHFDKFISDIITLLDNDILIDFMGKSNFFYDESVGFQFIDIDSHSDNKYDSSREKFDGKLICAYNGFVPCHVATGPLGLEEKALSKLDEKDLFQLSEDNKIIFEKCKTAMINSGVTEEQLKSSLEYTKIFGLWA